MGICDGDRWLCSCRKRQRNILLRVFNKHMTYSTEKERNHKTKMWFMGLWSVRSRGWLRSSAHTRHPRLLSRELELVKSQRNSNLYEIFLGSVCFPSLPQTLYTSQEIPLISTPISIFSRKGRYRCLWVSQMQHMRQVQHSSFVYASVFTFFFFLHNSKSGLSALVYLHREAGV
jgi:hypothetical protein